MILTVSDKTSLRRESTGHLTIATILIEPMYYEEFSKYIRPIIWMDWLEFMESITTKHMEDLMNSNKIPFGELMSSIEKIHLVTKPDVVYFHMKEKNNVAWELNSYDFSNVPIEKLRVSEVVEHRKTNND